MAVESAERQRRSHILLRNFPAKAYEMNKLIASVRQGWSDLPQLVRFLFLHAAIGIGAGWLLLALLLATDVNGVGALIFASELPALPLAMLAAGFAITFGGAAAGAAVMMMRHEGDDK